jgi:hypothetical protein
MVMIVLFFIVVGYGVYSFFYIKNEIVLIGIEATNNANSGDIALKSKQNKDIMKGITTLNSRLEEFAAKEKTYSALVKIPISAGTTTVATSTN